MKQKLLTIKSLLVAVLLGVGVNGAWADKTYMTSMTGLLGLEDNSTPAWTYYSKTVTIKAGETCTYTFTNYTKGGEATAEYQTWIAEIRENTTGYCLDARGDGGGWTWDGDPSTGTLNYNYSGKAWNEGGRSLSDFMTAYNGVPVTLTISCSNDGKTVTITRSAKLSDNTTDYSGTWTCSGFAGNDKTFNLIAEASHINITNVTYTDASDNVTDYSVTTQSCYVDQSNSTTNYNGASLTELKTYYCQHRVDDSSNPPVKVNSGGKIAFYKFDISSLKSQGGTLEDATFSVNLTGSGDGKYIANIFILGYNGTWDASTLTYSTMSNSAGSVGGTVTDGASFQKLANTETQSSGTSFPQAFSKGVKAYLQSAIDENKDYITIAVIHNSTREAKWATSASLETSFNSATPTTYTIKYHDGEGNELKADKDYDTFTGTEFTASASDMAAFYKNDYTKVYTYSSGNEVKTAVATAASNVITLVFDVADNAQYTHTINATGDVSKNNIASITLYEGQTGTVYYNKYIQDGGNWYYTNSNGNSGSSISYGVSVSATGSTNKSYTSASITNFMEVEDMNKSHSWATEGTASRASNGKAPRFYNDSYAFTEPIAEGGTYNITLGGRGVANDATVELYVGTKSNSTSVTDMVSKGTFSSWSNAGIAEITINDVVVEPGQVIVLKNPRSDGNCNVEADYIYYTKTADYTVSKAISSAGWATYCSPYALDLANATGTLTDAYIVTGGADGVLAKTSVKDGTVDANTGLLLKGSGEITIPVVASGTDYTASNKLIGVTANTAIDANAGYVLMGTPTLGFYKNNNAFTVGANTAYLPADFAGAGAPAFFSFDSETTGVNDVRSKMADVRGEFYNLAGQRVAKPTKGLYIVNGKKITIK